MAQDDPDALRQMKDHVQCRGKKAASSHISPAKNAYLCKKKIFKKIILLSLKDIMRAPVNSKRVW